jgi:ubiquinone/menaquinone biosynthesis C-methylase UbiE
MPWSPTTARDCRMLTAAARPTYLCVDRFMGDAVGARALHSALELGLIDYCLRHSSADSRSAAAACGLDERALQLLLGMLRANGVIELREGQIALTTPFVEALGYRDLLEAKLDFAALVAPDFLQMFSTLLTHPGRFFELARVFELFSYERCFEATPENLAATRRWMRFTTALTRHEAQACIEHHDFSACRRLLDVGGNSGEFALRLCRAHPELRATVLDLPLVCQIGRAHVAAEAEAPRIEFVSAGATPTEFPSGVDTVCFKSMLHDWPDDEMRQFLERAWRALDRGGRLVICERGPIEVGAGQIPYAQVPIMLFFRSYRSPRDYVGLLEQIGFRDIAWQTIELEMPFMLLTAVK